MYHPGGGCAPPQTPPAFSRGSAPRAPLCLGSCRWDIGEKLILGTCSWKNGHVYFEKRGRFLIFGHFFKNGSAGKTALPI